MRREHLRRAKELLATGRADDVRYAALELRLCLEAMTYDKLRSFAVYLPPSFLKRTWQPPQLLKAMMQFDSHADQSFQLFMGAEAVPGVPAKAEDMKFFGEHKAFGLGWLTKHYHKLGSFLHVQPNAASLVESKQRADLTAIAGEIEEAQTGSILGSLFVDFWRFECMLCKEQVKVSRHYIEAEHRAVCLNAGCEAEYDVEIQADQPVFALRASNFPCESCGEQIVVETRHLAPGFKIACMACKREHVIRCTWQYGTVGEQPPKGAPANGTTDSAVSAAVAAATTAPGDLQVSERAPLPRWKRFFAPHAVALDYLGGLVRYRPFDASKDLNAGAKGYLADVLQRGRIFVPIADTFNDPWEAAPSLEPVGRKDVHRQIAEFLSFLTPDLDSPARSTTLLEELRALPPDAVLERASHLLLDKLSRTPILSLSERPDNLLMWSYYARGHNGYALVFNSRAVPFAGAARVRYSRRHPRIPLTLRDMRGISAGILATKARQWRHEGESRVITSAANATRIGFTTFEPASAEGFYATFAPDCLVGVILGDRLFEGPHSQDVLALLRDHAPRVQPYLARIDRRQFQVLLRPLRFVE